jgi:D-tyrosyl-tRNA(Tyr) deacylase
MKAVIQRVKNARLTCGDYVCEIGKGLVVFFGVEIDDDESKSLAIAKKISKMRIFEDENGKMNLSVTDIGGEILAVSQFTLMADCSGGNRPSFALAEKPERANNIYKKFVSELKELGQKVQTGVFGGDMLIEQANDGPVTIIYEV